MRPMAHRAAWAAAPLLAATALLGSGAGQAQDDKMARPGGEATIYRDADYRGPAVFVGEAKADLGLA